MNGSTLGVTMRDGISKSQTKHRFNKIIETYAENCWGRKVDVDGPCGKIQEWSMVKGKIRLEYDRWEK